MSKKHEPTVTPLVLSINQAAQSLGLSRATVTRMIAAGDLRARRAGTRVLIPAGEVRRFLDEVDSRMTTEFEWLESDPKDGAPLVCPLCGALVDQIVRHEAWHETSG